MAEPKYDVLWPLARRAVNAKGAAPRAADLSGKTVAEFWDYIFRGDVMYPMVRDLLRARFPGIRFVDWREFGNIHGNQDRELVAAIPDKLKELRVDAVISGIGA